MNQPLIVLSPQNMPMEAPFPGAYNYTNTFNTAAIREAGGIPVIPPYLDRACAEALLARADGLFLTGGADVNPALYGQTPIPECGEFQPQRDENDRILLETALKLRKPILCICRGCQFANVYFGGTLCQDLPTQKPGTISHSVCTREEFCTPVHEVTVLPGTPLAELFGAGVLPVNSLHHQAVETLGPGLLPMALSGDGIVESWYLPDPGQWLRAYQWHPEMLREEAHRRTVFEDFLRQA